MKRILAALSALTLTVAGAAAEPAVASFASPAVTGAPATCRIVPDQYHGYALDTAIDIEPVQLMTTCQLRAPLTLLITDDRTGAVDGTITWVGNKYRIIGNGAVGIWTQIAANYRPGGVHDTILPQPATSADGTKTYLTVTHHYLVNALSEAHFTGKQRTYRVRRTSRLTLHGQQNTFSYAALTMKPSSRRMIGLVRRTPRSPSDSGWTLDKVDNAPTAGKTGLTTWTVRSRCGSWQYEMQPVDGPKIYGFAFNEATVIADCQS